ncbi:unnamed protein product [Owenia fusiformis]|uniref:Uncharacterized protein n=1 Tax=Owenia fusiformis TaxID=6347 RepID=A0A8J1U2S5_OWEFU|nr:unnamed protein product [Owenia fusiformis]
MRSNAAIVGAVMLCMVLTISPHLALADNVNSKNDNTDAWVMECGKSKTECDLRNSFCEEKMDKCSSCPDFCEEWRIKGNIRLQQQCYQICSVWMYLNQERKIQESQMSFSEMLHYATQMSTILLTVMAIVACFVITLYFINKRNQENEQMRCEQRLLTEKGEKPQLATVELHNITLEDEVPYTTQHHQHGTSREPLLPQQCASSTNQSTTSVNSSEPETTLKQSPNPREDSQNLQQ